MREKIMSRPRARKQRETITIGVRLSKGEYKRLWHLARADDVTLSDEVRIALSEIIIMDEP